MSKASWLHQRAQDTFFHKAKEEGWRSRAAYKLLALDEGGRLLPPGSKVVDAGAAPGSWSQVAARRVGPKGKVVAVDLLPIVPIPGVEVIQGDFTQKEVQEKILERFNGSADVLLADLAPNLSGNRLVDEAKSSVLVEAVLEFASCHLQPGGRFVVKFFEGANALCLLRQARNLFEKVKVIKPEASRRESREKYMSGEVKK